MSKSLALVRASLAAPVLFAAQATAQVPQPVIDECNRVATSPEMPDCLKEGAVAFAMLDLVRRDEFYGSAAEDVVAGCREANTTFAATWSCFSRAADDAVETRELIGVENMVDRCYAAVSDPATRDHLDERYAQARQERFGDEVFFGGGLFYPIQGCRAPAEEETASRGAGETGASDDGLIAEACAAYRDLEGVLKTHTSDELRVTWAALDAVPGADDPSSLAPLGVSETTIEFLQTANEDEGMATAVILAALLDRHHPDLMDEMSGGGMLASSELGGDLGEAFAQGMFEMVLEGYEEGCAPVSGG